jgi:hypothetical protein
VAAVTGERRVELDGEDGLEAVVLANAAELSLELGVSVRVRRRRDGGALRHELDVRPERERATPDPSTG